MVGSVAKRLTRQLEGWLSSSAQLGGSVAVLGYFIPFRSFLTFFEFINLFFDFCMKLEININVLRFT